MSRSEQQTPGRNPEEVGINNGEWYFTPYDKTHDLSVTSNYELNKKWSLSANFLFQTGQPITYPILYSSFSHHENMRATICGEAGEIYLDSRWHESPNLKLVKKEEFLY